MSKLDFFNLLAKKLGAPDGWQWCRIEALGDPKERRRERQFSVMEGYVHNGATFKSGKRKGQPKPRSAVPGTERTFHFTMQDLDDLQRQWEVETGNCFTCEGTGRALAGWSRDTGDRFENCHRCGATGKAVTP